MRGAQRSSEDWCRNPARTGAGGAKVVTSPNHGADRAIHLLLLSVLCGVMNLPTQPPAAQLATAAPPFEPPPIRCAVLLTPKPEKRLVPACTACTVCPADWHWVHDACCPPGKSPALPPHVLLHTHNLTAPPHLFLNEPTATELAPAAPLQDAMYRMAAAVSPQNWLPAAAEPVEPEVSLQEHCDKLSFWSSQMQKAGPDRDAGALCDDLSLAPFWHSFSGVQERPGSQAAVRFVALGALVAVATGLALVRKKDGAAVWDAAIGLLLLLATEVRLLTAHNTSHNC